jgi:ADP-ribose pyrophosphatase YjhB (NUDIX family)
MSGDARTQRVAAKAVIEAEGGILILHPSEIDLNRKWHIPGGIRDAISESITDTVIREVSEETGINLANVEGRVCMVSEWPGVDKGEAVKILAVFYHFKLLKRPKIVLSDEHDDATWVGTRNYINYEANPEVGELVRMLLP